MKKVFAVLLAITLLLSGCSFTAGPASFPSQHTQFTEATNPTGSTYIDEATQDHVATLDWSTDPFLSCLPEMKKNVSWEIVAGLDYETHISTTGLTIEDVRDYTQQLVDAGFCFDQYSKSEMIVYSAGDAPKEFLSFTARDENWNVVEIFSMYQPQGNGSGNWLSQLVVSRLHIDTEPPADSVKNKEPWDADKLRAVVPDPPTDYWNDSPNSDGIELSYLSIDQARSYADELRAAGFVYRQKVRLNMRQGIFKFSGQNAQGYTAQITYGSVTSQLASSSAGLVILEPGNEMLSGWENTFPTYIPKPATEVEDWSATYLPIVANSFNIYGMSYQGAQAYVEQIEQATQAYGWEFELRDTSEQDDANEYLNCQMLLREPLKNDVAQYQLHYWTLIYDPSNAECPCILVNN